MRILLACVLLAMTIACDKYTGIRGTIHDESGRPVSGADVDLSASNSHLHSRRTSEPDGRIVVGGTHGMGPGDFSLTVTKDGFKPLRATVPEGISHVEIVLVRIDAVGASRLEAARK